MKKPIIKTSDPDTLELINEILTLLNAYNRNSSDACKKNIQALIKFLEILN